MLLNRKGFQMRPRACIGLYLLSLLAVSLLSLQSGCIRHISFGQTEPLARVNGEPVGLDYIRMSFRSRHGDILLLLREEGVLKKYLDRAIDLKLLSQEAYRIGLDEDPQVKASIGAFKRRRAMELMLKELLRDENSPEGSRKLRETLLSDLRNTYEIEIHEEILPRLLLEDKGDISQGVSVAEVDGEVVTAGDLLARLNRDKLRKLPESKAVARMKASLNSLIDDLLLKREAERRGYMEREELRKEAAFFKETLIRNLLYEKVILPYIRPSESEVEAYYRKHPEEFTMPERIKVSHILLKSREEADRVLSELREGASFERLALKHSADRRSAARLGMIGWVSRGMLDPEFERAAFSLKIGETSNIVKTRFGFHIIRVDGRKEARRLGLSEAKRLVYDKVLEKKRSERISFFLEKLRERSTIEIDSKRVEELQRELTEGEGARVRSGGPD